MPFVFPVLAPFLFSVNYIKSKALKEEEAVCVLSIGRRRGDNSGANSACLGKSLHCNRELSELSVL